MPDRILDTSTVSGVMREDPTVTSRLAQVPAADTLFVSVITHAEIRYGIERLPAGRRRQKVERAYAVILPRLGAWLDVSLSISGSYATMKATLVAGGVILPDNDLWIAATALSHNLVLVSNDRHFARVPGLVTENWSTP